MKGSFKWAAALCAALMLLPAIGWADTVTVNASVSNGSRTLAIKSLEGSSLSSLSLGSAGTSGFSVSVTDVRYNRAGYQVTANLSDLYEVVGNSFDCNHKIDASNLSMSFLSNPTSATGIGGLATPVWNLTGTLSGALAGTLGVGSGTVFNVTNLQGTNAEKTLGGVFTGAETTLPISVSSGQNGAFTAPAAHSTCAPAPGGSPTTRLVMSGGKQDAASMFAWVQNAFVSAADQNSNGTVTGTELVNSGGVDSSVLATATRTALGTAGVSLPLFDTLVNAGTVTMTSIYNTMTATLQPLAALTGQSGTYLSLPALNATIPNATPSGSYRGTLTITLTDV